MQVVWQYHAEEPVSVAAGLPEDGTVRGSRPLYLVQRDSLRKHTSRNQDTVSLETWDVLNQQVSSISFILRYIIEKPQSGQSYSYITMFT